MQISIWLTSKHGQRGGVLHGGKRTFEGLRGFTCLHFVCKLPWLIRGLVPCWCVGVAFVWFFVVCLFSSGKICFQFQPIPAVDRPCLALVRQCREKKQERTTPREPKFHTECLALSATEKILVAVSMLSHSAVSLLSFLGLYVLACPQNIRTFFVTNLHPFFFV